MSVIAAMKAAAEFFCVATAAKSRACCRCCSLRSSLTPWSLSAKPKDVTCYQGCRSHTGDEDGIDNCSARDGDDAIGKAGCLVDAAGASSYARVSQATEHSEGISFLPGLSRTKPRRVFATETVRKSSLPCCHRQQRQPPLSCLQVVGLRLSPRHLMMHEPPCFVLQAMHLLLPRHQYPSRHLIFEKQQCNCSPVVMFYCASPFSVAVVCSACAGRRSRANKPVGIRNVFTESRRTIDVKGAARLYRGRCRRNRMSAVVTA